MLQYRGPRLFLKLDWSEQEMAQISSTPYPFEAVIFVDKEDAVKWAEKLKPLQWEIIELKPKEGDEKILIEEKKLIEDKK